jgi:hypothetical protein
MKTKTKIILLLLFLSPALGELITASSPPLQFFNPIVLLLFICLYGCGTLLIREAKVRWKLQWSVIFLAIAYGILEEGTMVQSFFNPDHVDLGILSRYGMYFGVQWPWTIGLILYHATISTLVPIAIVELLWPKYKYVSLLKKRGLILALTGVILVTVLFVVFVIPQQWFPTYEDYQANSLLIFASLISIGLLIWLSWKYRQSRILTRKISLFSPFVFGVFGFLFMLFNLGATGFLAEARVPAIITLFVQLVGVVLTLLFVAYQIYHQNITNRHIVSLIIGLILFWILLTPFHEFGLTENPDPTQGMLAVGIVSLILLVIWRNIVLKKAGYKRDTKNEQKNKFFLLKP